MDMGIIFILFFFYKKTQSSNSLTSNTAGKETMVTYFSTLIITVDCKKKVLEYAPTGFDDHVERILTEGTQKDVWSLPWRANSWISGEFKTDREAFILIDLGCTKNINGFYLRKAKT